MWWERRRKTSGGGITFQIQAHVSVYINPPFLPLCRFSRWRVPARPDSHKSTSNDRTILDTNNKSHIKEGTLCLCSLFFFFLLVVLPYYRVVLLCREERGGGRKEIPDWRQESISYITRKKRKRKARKKRKAPCLPRLTCYGHEGRRRARTITLD